MEGTVVTKYKISFISQAQRGSFFFPSPEAVTEPTSGCNILRMLYFKQSLRHECTDHSGQVSWVTKLCMVAPNICRSLVWNFAWCHYCGTYSFRV